MNPTVAALALLVTALLVVLSLRNRVLGGTVARLRRQRDAIETEEHRMFEFLHGLGEALSREGAADTAILHRTIVRGASMVVDAHGAALFLLDRSGQRLVPQYVSDACPPIIPIPPAIAEKAKTNPNALASYRRLTSVGRDWGPFGEALRTGRTKRVSNLAMHPGYERAHIATHAGTSALVAPLIYGGKPLGVLVVADSNPADTFSDNDFDVFRSVAEQSAFALGNAIVHQQAAEKRRLDQELATASEVQRILLPDEAPRIAGFDIAGANAPAKMVSGDYFDFFPAAAGGAQLGVVIADVSGKGVPASLIMAMCRSVVRTHAAATTSPAAVLAAANRQLFPDIREDMFISLAYATLTPDSGEITFARAGHDPPLLYRAASDVVEPVEAPGMAIGIDAGKVFARTTRDFSFELEPGDVLLLYTDGVNEAVDLAGDEFGLDRLYSELRRHASESAADIVEGIRASVNAFTGDVPQADDITLIAIKRV